MSLDETESRSSVDEPETSSISESESSSEFLNLFDSSSDPSSLE